jgi:hypothetical protein
MVSHIQQTQVVVFALSGEDVRTFAFNLAEKLCMKYQICLTEVWA